MQRVKIGGVELDHEVLGSGQPLLLIHGAHIAEAMRPLAVEPVLERYQRILYHRRGFAGSTHVPGPTSIDAQVDDIVGLLDHLGVERTHVAGHSGGALVALGLAAARPERVRSLALLEPGFADVPSGAMFLEVIGSLLEQYTAGDAAGAVDAFLALVGEDTWRSMIERTVPGGVEQAEKDAATFFECELPAFASWRFTAAEAAAIACPVLSVLGTASSPLFAESRERLHEWFPRCADADIAGATHMLQIQQPRQVAEALGRFLESC